MRFLRKWPALIFLLSAVLSIRIYAANSLRVETGYSSGFYPAIGRFLRRCLGKIPFSVGDVLYGLLFLAIIVALVRMYQFRRQFLKKHFLKQAALSIVAFSCVAYLLFNLLWGINYNRKGIAWQLGLDLKKYDSIQLIKINCLLVDRLNELKAKQVDAGHVFTHAQLFAEVQEAYRRASIHYPFLQYEFLSIKPGLWRYFQSYTGITGYYNPFTGEAQLNTRVPAFIQPYTSCHEVAHQLGYAKEMEANFVGYLAAASSTNDLFRYSVYFDLFLYANRNLYMADSLQAKMIRKELLPAVLADIKTWRKFNEEHQSIAEPVVRWIYGYYLRGNQQPEGINSYDEVTGFIIAYYERFGKI